MLEFLDSQHVASIFQDALTQGVVDPQIDTAVSFHSVNMVEDRMNAIRTAFPIDTVHTVAIKANPFFHVLQHAVKNGFGLEAASLPELQMALEAGGDPNRIAFDSPAKTSDELMFALKHGVIINLDNLQEVALVANKLIPKLNGTDLPPIGLRLNPEIGAGRIAATDVSREYSKFGVPVSLRQEILDVLRSHEWISGIHVHAGSQGYSVAHLADAVQVAYEILVEANRLRETPLVYFDIGGGLSVRYLNDDEFNSVHTYVSLLRLQCPLLFSGSYRIITEFGRWVHANAGWSVARVEYTKRSGDLNTAVCHLGADLFIRECYASSEWKHRITVLDYEGRLKTNCLLRYNVAGPLCFAGDIIARDVMLPEIEQGDYVVIHDTGAYTHSMWSRYNSRQQPKVLGYRSRVSAPAIFNLIRERESVESVLKYWR